MKLIPPHCLTDRLREIAALKNYWSFQKTSRTIFAGLLWLKIVQELGSWGEDSSFDLNELLTLPAFGLLLTLITMTMAAIVSWVEEVTGEDGLELSDESEEED
jgi:hypothetical protein